MEPSAPDPEPAGACSSDLAGVASPGKTCIDVGARGALVADLEELISRHCQQLGELLDRRLEAHHTEFMQILVEEVKPRRRHGPIYPVSMRHIHGRHPLPTQPAASPREEAAPAPDATASEANSHGRHTDHSALQEDHQGSTSQRNTSSSSRGKKEEHRNLPFTPPWRRRHERSDDRRDRTASSFELSFDESERQRMKRSMMVAPSRVMDAVRGLELKTWEPGALHHFVRSQCFETLMCLVIMSNVCFFGFEVQSLWGLPEEDVPVFFKAVEYSFTGIFSVELLLRVLAAGIMRFFLGKDWAWNLIDVCLVIISFLELGLELLNVGGSHKLTYVRMIRLAKTVRIFRVVRVMKIFRPLRILVFSIMNTLRSLGWTLFLLLIVIYSFGVLFTMASSQAISSGSSSDPALLQQYFGSLWMSIASLFQAITGGMDWRFSADALMTLNPIWVSLYVGYIAFSQLALLNVVTGVVCQTAMESAAQDEDIIVQARLALHEKYVAQLRRLFGDLDSDSLGKITLPKFQSRLQDSSMKAYLDALDLTTDQAWSLFKLLDVHETSMIDVDDFVSGCLRLRGTARSIDIHMLMYESRWTMNKLSKIMTAVQELSSSVGEAREAYEHCVHLAPSQGSHSLTLQSPSSQTSVRAAAMQHL